MLDPDIRVAPVTSVVANAVRLVADSQSDDLFYMTRAGTIYRVNIASGSSDALYSTVDHGLGTPGVYTASIRSGLENSSHTFAISR